MTHTNLRTCPSCRQEKLVREFRDRWNKVRTKCSTCRQTIQRRANESRYCIDCGKTKPFAEFNAKGRVRARCHDCRARRRLHCSADTWPDYVGTILRGWR